MNSHIHRIGVLTGGGDAPGLNAVIRAVVKTANTEYDWHVLGIEDSFEGLLQPGKVRALGMEAVRGILPRGGTILGTTNRGNPFQYPRETETGVRTEDISGDVIRRAFDFDIDAMVVIGGDGTLHIALEFQKRGLNLVGVPKTIDNDILLTDFTFGFDTAVNIAMEALDRLHTTAESHHRTIILEVMGREAGWIALRAGIAGGADIILIPEIPFEIEHIVEKIQKRERRGPDFNLIVAAEGAYPVGGMPVFQEQRLPGAAPRLGGIGEAVASQLRQQVDQEVRVTVLGYLQRGGTPTAYDRILASEFGVAAVHALARGEFGSMIAVQGTRIVTVPIAEAIAHPRFVPLDSPLITTALGLDISLGRTREEIRRMRQEQENVT